MVQKINQLVETLLQSLSKWKDVDSVLRIPYHSGDVNPSPLFCLKLDVYLGGDIPQHEERLASLPQTQFIETSLSRSKDRFFLDDVPVHIEYKKKALVDGVLDSLAHPPYSLLNDTTYGLFRLLHGIPVLSLTSWIQGIKKSLEDLSEDFWSFHRQNLAGRLEHLLSDMSAAVFNRDPFFFQISTARFLETVAETLFTVNRRFLCPPEEILFQLENLETLPTGFAAYFGTMIRQDQGSDSGRRLELARHLTESILSFI